MNKKIKYFVCDVDGTTLMLRERSFSSRTIDAFNEILNSGNKIIVASGRTYANLKFLFNNNKDIIYLCENGSLIVEDDKDLIVHYMEIEDVKSLFNYALLTWLILLIEQILMRKNFLFRSILIAGLLKR